MTLNNDGISFDSIINSSKEIHVRFKPVFLYATFAIVGLSACSGDNSGPAIVPLDPVVTVAPASLTIQVGQQATVAATVTSDTTGSSSGVTWSSSASTIASVNAATGQVTAVAAGTATITAASKLRPAKTATSVVTVTERPATTIQVSPSYAGLTVGQTVSIAAVVTNDTVGALSGVSWSSSAPNVAAVNATTGQVTALAGGTTIITATSKYRPGASATVAITVFFPTSVTLAMTGSGLVPERYTAEIAVRGNYAYTTSWGTRAGTPGNSVKIWNVAGATPILVDSLKISTTSTTSDVQISPDGTLLVVSTEGQSGGSIVIYNLSNPAAPTLISRYQTAQTTRGVHTVKLSVINGKLYGFLQIDPASAQELIVDMSNPASVQQVFVKVMGTPYVHDVFVRDGLLFAALWNDGMTIFDVGGGGKGGSPSNPIVLGIVKTKTGQIHNIWWLKDPVTGITKYVFLGEEGTWNGVIGSGGVTAGDVHVIDVSDMSAPKEVAMYSPGPGMGTHNFWVDEQSGILYAAYYNGGVRAIDVRGDLSTCTVAQRASYNSVTEQPLCDLRLMGREAGSGLTAGGYFVWGVMMQGNRLYVSDMGKGLVVLDISPLKR